LPEFQDGKITIALKSFLRREAQAGKAAPPTGHLSVWLEQAEVPESVLKAYEPKQTITVE
jgi:hypothetical protein